MESSYQQGNGGQPMMGYFQGMPGYNVPNNGNPSSNPGTPRQNSSISIWAGDLDAYMDENFLRQAVTASGWGADITRIKVVRDHYTGMHAGYGFLDAASPEAAERVIATGSGMPIPGTNRCWRLNMGRNAACTPVSSAGAEINIYVGNLEPSVTDYQLMTAFRPRYGSVRHAKVVCNEYGQSRGFGFVRFGSPQDAERAVSEMQGYEFNNKPIRLSPATGRTRTGGRGGPPGGFGGHHNHGGHGPPTNKRPRQLMSPDDPNNTTIFIGGTGNHITEDLLWREFSTFGELEAVRVPVNKTGFAFVRFKRREDAERAKNELSGTHFISLNPNKPVRIEWASEQIAVSKPPMGHNSMNSMFPTSGGSQSYDPQYNPSYNPNHSGQNLPASGSQSFNSYPPQSSHNDGLSAPGSSGLSQPSAQSAANGVLGSKQEDKSQSGADIGASVNDGSNPKNDSMTGPGNGGETEPPSKRAAVGRPEYASARNDGSKKDAMSDGKPDGVPEDSPAMQFSWLNASSTTPASNSQ
eukprot:GFKZ01005291.1.p1 GENE.GFKZ01005291.1~~GFKZ01005291.1.p1  ORF type:complete len:523 (+),score=53.75 GFKZ01005291.1:901-2469(+)